MDLWSLAKIISEETSTIKYIKSISDKNIECKFCTSNQFYPIKRTDTLRCKLCKKNFKPFFDSSFSLLRISYSKWLVLIKLFEISSVAKVAVEQAQVDYKTALKAFDIFRHLILDNLNDGYRTLEGGVELDEAYFGGKAKGKRGRGAQNKTIVLGILEMGGKVRVDIIPDVTAKTLVDSTVKKVKKGSITYTDKWKAYDALIFHGYKHESVDHNKIYVQGRVHINGMEGFWGFAKTNLAKYRGVSSAKFLLYLKEMEWRYNNRDRDLFDLLLQYSLGARNEQSPSFLCS